MSWYEKAKILGRTEEQIRKRRSAYPDRCDAAFYAGESGICLNLLPRDAVEMDCRELLTLLRRRFGESADAALSSEWTDPDRPASDAPGLLGGPVAATGDSGWLGRTNMVGVNVRTVRDFSGVLKYTLTLSDVHDSVHLLPVWEPGVVGSLYGISSRYINPEFFSADFAAELPHLDTPARQLKAVVNVLHLMGKAVGMDVIPHTDRYSEIVLAYPEYFEWLRREDTVIADHRANLHEEVQEQIRQFLAQEGPALTDSAGRPELSELPPGGRQEYLLFGPPDDIEMRTRRRVALARHLYRRGYEPVPATMAPPYRGLEVDTERASVGGDGHVWREYRITRPESMSRVFGPLTRYKLYERLNDNSEWEIDFSRPREEVWDFVRQWYGSVQRSFGFDFMRGDMSHVQMRPEGVPAAPDEYYDLLGAVAGHIREVNGAPYFGYFAETFIAPPGIMAYGDEIDHLEASRADVTLGDLQSRRVDSPEFVQQLRLYHDIGSTRSVTPSFTVMTADKDDPRFDDYYLRGNEARYFTALFLTDMPSYTALNFENRDVHYAPAPNEEYTKLYVFHETDGPKATHGPFRFGRNGRLFFRISRIRLFAEEFFPQLVDRSVRWLLPPDATAGRKHISWAVGSMVFLVNFGAEPLRNVHVPVQAVGGVPSTGEPQLRNEAAPGDSGAELLFSTDETRPMDVVVPFSSVLGHLVVPDVAAGEGLAFKFSVLRRMRTPR